VAVGSESGQTPPIRWARHALVQLDPHRAYRAMLARDRRFDGLFYVGVSTTGVYCRPICPARTPREDRCSFHASAALAERAGFRACFRCRPELAPGQASIDSVSRLAGDASRRIEEGALDHAGNLETLAAELSVSSRHLRRVLESELGVSPLALAETRRLATAKQLLTDTSLGMAEIAFASGFGSVRRFNDAFVKRFGDPPRAFKIGRKPVHAGAPLPLRLSYRPPFDWTGLLDYLGPRAIPGLEEVRGEVWRRLVSLDGVASVVEVRDVPEQRCLIVSIAPTLSRSVRTLVRLLRALFDLDAQPEPIGRSLAPDLGALVKAAPGLRVPGALDPFELAVRAVLGQQVSVRGATTLAARLVERFGAQHDTGDTLCRSFPNAATLASVATNDLARIGLPTARAETIRRLSERVHGGELRLEGPLAHHEAVEETIAALVAQPGIGPWTAEYIAMRALRWPDAFVAGDLGVRKALGGGVPISEREARARAEAFRPFRAYAVLHLWRSLAPPKKNTPRNTPPKNTPPKNTPPKSTTSPTPKTPHQRASR
jgi:AraC family transcriptional regulator of adaptative response / DNA-3-methyladenine glycosylase II